MTQDAKTLHTCRLQRLGQNDSLLHPAAGDVGMSRICQLRRVRQKPLALRPVGSLGLREPIYAAQSQIYALKKSRFQYRDDTRYPLACQYHQTSKIAGLHSHRALFLGQFTGACDQKSTGKGRSGRTQHPGRSSQTPLCDGLEVFFRDLFAPLRQVDTRRQFQNPLQHSS